MGISILVAASHVISSALASTPLSITPFSVNTIEYVDVVAQNDEWTLTRDSDWALSLHLDHEAYGFGGIGDSSLSITLNGVCNTDRCDAVLAVSFDDDLFLPLPIDLFQKFGMPSGIPLVSGDASQLLSSFVDAMDETTVPDGDMEAAMPMSVSLEFVNNYEDNTLSLKLNGIELEVSGRAVPIHEDLTLYLLPIGEGEIMQIFDIEVDGQNIGSEDDRAYALANFVTGGVIAGIRGIFTLGRN